VYASWTSGGREGERAARKGARRLCAEVVAAVDSGVER
jgi:hypothetical protein